MASLELLLVACGEGDRDAVRRLYELTSSQLMGVAMRLLRRRDLAEDVLHDAFIQIWQRAGTFEPGRGTAQAWIVAIVRYRALDVLRRMARRAGDEPDVEALDLPDPGPSAFERLGRFEDLKRLQGCLDQIGEESRHCILLAHLDGYTHEQIAAQLDRPLGTIKSWIRRGLQALKSCLSE